MKERIKKLKRFTGFFLGMLMIFVSIPIAAAPEEQVVHIEEISDDIIFENLEQEESSSEILEYVEAATASETAPTTPTNFRVTNRGPSTFSFAWDTSQGTAPIIYRIYMVGNPTPVWGGVNTSGMVSGLDPNTEYRFFIRAENFVGLSSPSNIVTTRTLLETMWGIDITAGSTFIEATWVSIDGATSYTVNFNGEYHFVSAQSRRFRMDGLSPGTSHFLSFRANNSIYYNSGWFTARWLIMTAVPHSVVLSDTSFNLEIPTSGTRSVAVGGSVLDQSGNVILGLRPMEYILTPANTPGVSINQTGVITVNSSAQPGRVFVRAVYSDGNISISSLSVPVYIAAEAVRVNVTIYADRRFNPLIHTVHESVYRSGLQEITARAARSFYNEFGIDMVTHFHDPYLDLPRHTNVCPVDGCDAINFYVPDVLEWHLKNNLIDRSGLHTLFFDAFMHAPASTCQNHPGKGFIRGTLSFVSSGYSQLPPDLEGYLPPRWTLWVSTRILQHEWSHNFGALDSVNCSPYQECTMRQQLSHAEGDRNIWCDNCLSIIKSNRNLHHN